MPDQQRVFQLDLVHCPLLFRQVWIRILMPSYIRYPRYEPLQCESFTERSKHMIQIVTVAEVKEGEYVCL